MATYIPRGPSGRRCGLGQDLQRFLDPLVGRARHIQFTSSDHRNRPADWEKEALSGNGDVESESEGGLGIALRGDRSSTKSRVVLGIVTRTRFRHFSCGSPPRPGFVQGMPWHSGRRKTARGQLSGRERDSRHLKRVAYEGSPADHGRGRPPPARVSSNECQETPGPEFSRDSTAAHEEREYCQREHRNVEHPRLHRDQEESEGEGEAAQNETQGHRCHEEHGQCCGADT